MGEHTRTTSLKPYGTTMDIATYLPHATSRLPMPDGSQVVLFEAYGLSFLREGDPYGPMLRFLYATGANCNVFRISKEGNVLWRVQDHNWKNDSSSDPFSGIADVGDHVVGTTGYGFEYSIDKLNGQVRLLEWYKM